MRLDPNVISALFRNGIEYDGVPVREYMLAGYFKNDDEARNYALDLMALGLNAYADGKSVFTKKETDKIEKEKLDARRLELFGFNGDGSVFWK